MAAAAVLVARRRAGLPPCRVALAALTLGVAVSVAANVLAVAPATVPAVPVARALAAVVLFALSGAFGGSAPSHLSAGGFDDPGAESSLGDAALADVLDAGPPNVIRLFAMKRGGGVR